ncbi:MAG: FKBP-type peptidyl-prolyl cis-trans isomerase [Bacteroidales bacterium]|nr:FKBP-type peptidyl-prolyl cis-trans isomerase [Bacteroidales bacterium]
MKNMKTPIITLAALLITINISAQQQTAEQTNVPQTVVKLNSPIDTLQYTLGAFIGQWMVKNGFAINDPVLFNRGMDDVLQNKPLAVVDSTIAPIISGYQLSNQNEKSRQMEEQLFAALKGKPGVGILPNGVHYIVIKTGDGVRPAAKDSIVFNAIGIFPDGTVFEDTYQKKQTISNVISNLIPGLNEAIQLMPEGSVWRIFVPSALAYGPAGKPNLIPPNTALVFDITLEEVKVNKE